MAAETATIHIILPLVVGFIIGIIEAYFVYEDENMTSGKDFLGDMWHGLIFAVFGVLIASNIPYILSQGWLPEWISNLLRVDANGNSIIASIIITIIMLLKMVGSHAIKGVRGGGFQEKFWHKLVIALAVGFAPYYILAMQPLLEPVTSKFPSWLK
jgi:hypothetical protein